MTPDAAQPEFYLHFEGEGARNHTVPASALVQAVRAIQRAVHLLALAHEGKDFKERLRVSDEVERKYAVVFSIPEDGGYYLPYTIGNAARTLFEPEDVAVVTKQYSDSLAAVQKNDIPALKRIIPNAAARRQFAIALKEAQPRKFMGLVVSVEDARKQKILDGRDVAARLDSILNESVSPSIQPRIVAGRLDGLDFQARSLSLTLVTGRRLTCTYAEDFEPVLLENPREWIQVRGEAVLNDDDSLKALNNVTEIVVVDNSPVVVTSLIIDGAVRLATTALSFPVSFDPAEGLYTACGDFHMMAVGETREELEKEISAALSFLWKEYVVADIETLSIDAVELRDELISRFKEEGNAT